MKKTLYYTMLIAVITLMWGCSSSDDQITDGDSTVNTEPSKVEKPNWAMQVFHVGNESKPIWTTPDYHNYESLMRVNIAIDSAFVNYSSDDDLVAAFIDGTCRGVDHPSVIPNHEYPVTSNLTIYGGGSASMITLKYYCAKLGRSFTISNWMVYNTAMEPSMDGEPYPAEFILGDSYNAETTFELTLPAQSIFMFNNGDEIAALDSDGKCCSYQVWNSANNVMLHVYGQEGSDVKVVYYSHQKQGVYEAVGYFPIRKNLVYKTNISEFKPVINQ